MKKQYVLAGLLCFILMSFGKTYTMLEEEINQIQQTYKSSDTLMSQEDINHVLQLNKPSGTWKERLMQFGLISYFVSLPDVSADVKQFVHDELKRIGLKNYESIKVKIQKCEHCPFAAYIDTIFITPGMEYTIALVLKKAQQFDLLTAKEQKEVTDALNYWRGAIQHEGGHIKHQHVYKQIMTLLAINGPLLYLSRLYKQEYYTLTLLGSIFSIFIQSYLFLPWYSRMQEQQADDTIVNEKAILEQCVKEYTFPLDKKDQYSDIFDSHPACWKRAERFQARIDALKKQSIKKISKFQNL